MATVHPSRLGLIPENLRPLQPSSEGSKQSLSPPHHPNQSQNRDRRSSGDRYPERDRGRGRSRSRDGGKDYVSRRRASPKYDDYKSNPSNAPGFQRREARMYPERGGGGKYAAQLGGNADWLERHVPRFATIETELTLTTQSARTTRKYTG